MSAKFPRGGGGGAGPFLARSLISISYLLGENNYNFPHDPFYEGIFSHVSVSVHCIFPKKCFRLKCIFIKLSV